MKKILLLNDFVSRGKIAGHQMNAILSYKDMDVFFLPTALISNKFKLKKFDILDTGDYIKNSLQVWKELNIKFDAVFIGFIKNQEQKNIIIDFIKNLDPETLVVLDPIMGDSGALYSGLDQTIVTIYREVMEYAHIIVPNITEARLLCGKDFDDPALILDFLSNHKRKVIITSAKIKDDYYIIAKEDSKKTYLPFSYIDKKFAGTGDIFDGIFLANYLNGTNLEESLVKTRDSMAKILNENINKSDGSDIVIEKYLHLV